MRALIIATGYRDGMYSLLSYRPTPLLRIIDKPIIYHIIEFLTSHGIKQLDLITHHLPHLLEEKLGDGSRWGVAITYHLCRLPSQPFETVTSPLQSWQGEWVLLGNSDKLPTLGASFLTAAGGHQELAVTPSKKWTGWARVKLSQLQEEVTATTTLEQLYRQLTNSSHPVVTKPFLSVMTLLDYKKSNEKSLSKKISKQLFPTTSREVEPSIWLSRAVSLHPSVKLVAPLFIGENCQIREGAQVGPYTIIENHCVIDKFSRVENSIIGRCSYIGEGLELHNSIVDRNLLINLDHETEITLTDEFILSDLTGSSLKRRIGSGCERLAALFFLLLFSPFFIVMHWCCYIVHREMVTLPVATPQSPWRTFGYKTFHKLPNARVNSLQRIFRRLPALLNILKGELHFVGLTPRTVQEVQQLPKAWQELYLKAKVGLITLTDLDLTDLDNGLTAADDDERYVSEAYYSANSCWTYDLHLVFRWLKKKMTGKR